MTAQTNNAEFNTTVLAELAFMREQIAALTKANIDVQKQLGTFEKTLQNEIHAQLLQFKEPTFINPATGNLAASLFSIMSVLRYDYRLH